MSLRLHVTGIQDCLDAFRDLPRKVRGRYMKQAMDAGGGVIRDAAVANIPSETGLAKKSLRVKTTVPDLSYNLAHHGRPAVTRVGPSWGVVGLTQTSKAGLKLTSQKKLAKRGFRGNLVQRRRPARYFHLIEKGTKAHRITAKNVRVLSSGTTIFGRSVKHPGTTGQFPLTKAVRSSGAAAQQKIIRKLHDGIANWVSARSARIRAKVGV